MWNEIQTSGLVISSYYDRERDCKESLVITHPFACVKWILFLCLVGANTNN